MELCLHLISVSSSLKSLRICGIEELISLPKELQHVSTLQTLKIEHCYGLATSPDWIGRLTSLTQLSIIAWPKLTSLPEEMRSLRHLCQLRIFTLTSLHRLFIQLMPNLVSLPKGLQYVSMLKTLRIWSSSSLATVPDWIGSISHQSSLTELSIRGCSKLMSLSKEVRSISNRKQVKN
ncbi:hypothetical protein PVL29_017648 [Vitis rotundifolia]|uniref:R13L1/DRL21-like LRR repeat region domain-containing protein n=1 Tax=Vitis rotundifolia TaxID=103349 RepID=A0AA38ZBX0_VITRO|nr:hypothetical protein PVL29_017648 [Vitis rotundifolia]